MNLSEGERVDLHKLKVEVAVRASLLLLLLAAMFFISAGTLSYWEAWVFLALIVAALLPFFLVLRIRNEEEVLIRELNGYSDYVQKVKSRLIPGMW